MQAHSFIHSLTIFYEAWRQLMTTVLCGVTNGAIFFRCKYGLPALPLLGEITSLFLQVQLQVFIDTLAPKGRTT